MGADWVAQGLMELLGVGGNASVPYWMLARGAGVVVALGEGGCSAHLLVLRALVPAPREEGSYRTVATLQEEDLVDPAQRAAPLYPRLCRSPWTDLSALDSPPTVRQPP